MRWAASCPMLEVRPGRLVCLTLVIAAVACASNISRTGADAGGVATAFDASVDASASADGASSGDAFRAGNTTGDSGAGAPELADGNLADGVTPSDAPPSAASPPSDATAPSKADGSILTDTDAKGGEASAPAGCVPGPAGMQRPPFAPPPVGCGNEIPGRRSTLAQQVATRATCPSPPVVETAIAPNCPLANPNDAIPDDDALQACLDKGGTIALPAGNPGFILAKGLTITQDGTTLRGADPAHPALFLAAATLANTMILGSSRANIVFRFLSLDGNRPARTAFLTRCAGYRSWASGLVVDFAHNFAVLDNRITRTLCGASLEVDGADFEIARNVIETNGHGLENRDASEPWADGITLHNCDNGQVHDNLVTDATDVGIVSGGGACDIEHNEVVNKSQHVFGGITLQDFFTTDVDHTGAVVAYNTVTGQNGMLAFGFSLGIHPWSRYPYITGGTLACNEVSGGVVNIEIDGAKSITVRDNAIGAPGTGTPRCDGAATGYTSYSPHVMSSTLQAGWTERKYDGCIP